MGDPPRNSENVFLEDEEAFLNSVSGPSLQDIPGNFGSQVFCIVIWIGFSATMIVIGSLYTHACESEPKIPIYLIVAGAVYLLGVGLLILKMTCVKRTYGLEVILGLFSLCWFITGSIWVFSIYEEDSRKCNHLLYNFTFGALIFQYIILAFASSFLLLSSCCAGFMATESVEEEEEEDEKAPLLPSEA